MKVKQKIDEFFAEHGRSDKAMTLTCMVSRNELSAMGVDIHTLMRGLNYTTAADGGVVWIHITPMYDDDENGDPILTPLCAIFCFNAVLVADVLSKFISNEMNEALGE